MSRVRRKKRTKTETMQRSFSSPFTRPFSKHSADSTLVSVKVGKDWEPNIPKKSEGVIMAPGPQRATQKIQMFRMQGADRAQTRGNSYKVISTNSFNIFPHPTSHQKSQPEAKLSKLGLFFLFFCLFSKHIEVEENRVWQSTNWILALKTPPNIKSWLYPTQWNGFL